MKRKITLRMTARVLAAILLALLNATAVFSNNSKDGTVILIEPRNDAHVGEPRGPVFNPFTAYRLNNTVVLESDTSYGLVNVTLVSTAGDYYTTIFDTEDGSVLILISGNSGNYSLMIADTSGTHFVGTFEI